MMIKRIDKRLATGLALVGVVSVVGLVGGFAHATTPSMSDGQVYGCYRNSASLTDAKGALRIIDKDASQNCTGSETALKWNPAGNTVGTVRKDAAGANLNSLEFRNRDMRGISFAGANLDGAILSNDDFGGVNLSGASLVGTTLINPSFKGANFTGATISHVFLPDIRVYVGEPDVTADFRDADFTGATLDKLDAPGPFWSYDFRGSNFNGATVKTFLASGRFSGIDFRNTTFALGDFNITGFHDADVSYANFSGMTLDNFAMSNEDTLLDHTNFSNTTITDAYFSYIHQGADGANFTNANFTNTDFSGSYFTTADFSNAHFKDSNFVDALIKHANFTGATWDNVICPDGSNSDNNGNTCVGHYYVGDI